ncbi:MAG: LytTR family DNA-binding domain-containing protein [Saprospiraceae bacterium]|nr:LytTR family DNA-binding domain-containing protein [Saprospiraceae bacterium]
MTNSATLRAIIIEDEERSRIVLKNLLETYCPQIEIIDDADSVKHGIRIIRQHQPDLMFLDIQLLDGTGFDILEKCAEYQGAIIFTTAFDQYALKAFKFSAIDYLLKPIDIEELKLAVQKATSSQDHRFTSRKISHLLSHLRRSPDEQPVLLVSTSESIEFVRICDIVRCEAHGAYCMLHFTEGKPLLASKVIKEFEFLLQEYAFFRVHQSHLVNLGMVRKYVKSHNSILMRDGKEIQVARSRKEGLIRAMTSLSQPEVPGRWGQIS